MYAIIKSGGKQYRVEKDDVIDVELIDADLGAQVDFEDILFINTGKDSFVGEPSVSGYVVKGEVVGNSAGPKLVSLKYVRRQHWRKKWGHRQHYTRIKILEIGSADQESKPKAAKKADAAPVNEEAKSKKTAKAKEEAAPKAEKSMAGKEKTPKATSKRPKKES